MKKLIYGLFALLLTVAMTSCEDELPTATLASEVGPNELQPISGNNFILVREDEAENFETLEWTAPDYGYEAGVTYVVQMDVEGNNFASPVELGTVRTLNSTFTVAKVNEMLLALGLAPELAADVEIRVMSTINSTTAPVFSNSQVITITPYATSFPPIWGMGAGLKGWGPWPDNAVEWQSSEYKKYETVAYFTNGQAFRWFAQLGWDGTSYNYPFFTTVSPIFENAADGDLNLRVTGPSGWYRVNVDLTAKTVTAVAVDEPVLYMMGSAVNGWGPWPDAAVKMTYIKPGVFETSTTLNNVPDNNTFRFFAQPNWGPTGYNYPYFSEGVDPLFENANDDDSNLRYIGTTGVQKIRVDLNAKTVTLGDPPAPVLFVTGDDFGWGWTDGSYEELTYNSGTGSFTLTTTLTNGNLFRFFPQKDWSPSYTFDYFTTVDSDLENQGAATDQNFRYIGTTGSRTITVNLTTKVVSLD